MGMVDRFLFRNGTRRNSPDWAFLEGFKVPHYDDPSIDYLWRLRIVQTPWFGIYLHKLCTADPRATLHDHPWSMLSLVLRGGYLEYVPGEDEYAVPRYVRRVNWKPLKNSFHWIAQLDRVPTWTLVFVGKRSRVWGYLEEDGTYTEFSKHKYNDEFLAAMNDRYGGGEMG